MSSIVISSFLLVIWFSPFSVSETKYYDWKKHHWNGIVEISNTDVRFKCSSSFGEGYSDVLDIYTTDWDGFVNCNASVNHSNLIGSIKCGANGTTLDLDEDKGRSYFFIGFVRQKATPNKRVLSGGTCAVLHYGTKNQLHICDSAIPVIGKVCDMSKCPLSLGVSDGRLLDRLISASSELDMKYSAKEGRISYRTDINRAWCAGPSTELASQYLQIDVLAIDLLSAVATQGAVEEKSWVNKYLIHYSLDGSDWIVLTDGKGEIKEFNGNNDERSIVRHWIKPFLKFRLVRFVPLSWVGLQCMRVEIHACRRDLSKSRDKIMKSLTKEPRPCAADNCSHLPHSMCLMYRGKLHCKCIQSCPREQAEVCGSDGKAYRNECDLKRTACVKKKKTEVVKPGPCQVSTVCDKKCVAPYSRCVIRGRKNQTCECIDQNCGQNTSRPVCGTDGKIYTSECLLKKTACENNTDISIVPYGHCLKSETERLTGGGTTTLCSSNSCPPYAKCIPGKKGDKQCICPSCSHNGKKVCGSDGKTYRDVCELKKYSCKVNHFVKVMSHGECDEGKKKDKMSIRALLMFFIGLMVIIVVMGVVILINTFIFEPLRRGQISDFKKTASRPLKDSSFKLLHSKYKVSG